MVVTPGRPSFAEKKKRQMEDSVPAEIDPLDQNLFVDDRYDNPAENTVG